MIGLLALLFFVLWGFIAYKISEFLTKKMKTEKYKKLTVTVLGVFIFFVPVADDIIGGFQFRALCKEKAVLTVDEQNIRGKTIVYQRVRDQYLNMYIIPILERNWTYKDADADEIVISWKSYEATGGWLSRLIGFPEGSPPYTFNGSCLAKEGFDFDFKKRDIHIKDEE
jgi:hypothetical protein